MSAGNPIHIIADSIEDHDGSPIMSDELAAHVVSKLTDAGYSIVPPEGWSSPSIERAVAAEGEKA